MYDAGTLSMSVKQRPEKRLFQLLSQQHGRVKPKRWLRKFSFIDVTVTHTETEALLARA